MSDKPAAEMTIFLTAIEIDDPVARVRYVDDACGHDAKLRADVEALLAAHDQDAAFLERPAGKINLPNEQHAAVAEQNATLDSDLHQTGVESKDVAATSLPQSSDGPGAVIGPYKLLQVLGEGGMGTVYMAEQTEPIRRKVALKIIKPGMDSRQVIARFETERQALALMDHLNIARVLDAGMVGPASDKKGAGPIRQEGPEGAEHKFAPSPFYQGRPYFVMELVKGVPITKYCDENRLTPRQRLELMIPVCRAIQHAHQKGIIHRDIKPSNVLISPYDGRPVPKVIDFGIAKATGQTLTEKTLFTEVGQIVGTLEYMSPEQAELNQLDIDTRSDVYALGVLLYELLTGTTPVTREQLKNVAFTEMLRTIREKQPPNPSTRLSGSGDALASISAVRRTDPARLSRFVRGDLDWIVMKALEKERARRYDTANALAADIERFLDDKPVEAGPPSAAYRLHKFVRRNKGPVLAASLVCLALVAGTVVSTIFGIHANYEARRADAQAHQAEKEANAARTAEALAEEREYDAAMLLTQTAWERSNFTRFLSTLTSQRPQPGEQDIRGFEWWYWWNMYRRDLTVLGGHVHDVRAVAFSRDGRLLASGGGGAKQDDRGMLLVWDAATREVIHRFNMATRVNAVAFSDDSTMLAAASGNYFTPGEVKVWKFVQKVAAEGAEADPPQLIQHFAEMPAQVDTVAFHPRGTLLAMGGGSSQAQGFVKVWHLPRNQEVLSSFGDRAHDLTFRPDGTLLAVATADESEAMGAKVTFWKMSRDGRQLDIDFEISTGTHRATSVAFSPDGRRIAVAVGGGIPQPVIKVWNMATRQMDVAPLTGHTNKITSVCFRSDGGRIASSSFDRTVKVWDALSGKELHTLRGHDKYAMDVVYDPDAQKNRLASASSDTTVHVRSVRSSSVVTTAPTSPLHCVAFHPTRALVASGNMSGSVQIWNALTGNEDVEFVQMNGSVLGLAFSSDGRLLATAGGEKATSGEIKVWDWEKKVLIHTFLGHSKRGLNVAFHPDGSLLASVAGGWEEYSTECKLWDLQTLREVEMPLAGPSGVVCSVAFSPDGEQVAWCGENLRQEGEVRIWNLSDQRQTLVLGGHAEMVISVAFSKDGQLIATGSADRTIKLWDAQTGRELGTLVGHRGRVHCVAFGPGNGRLASSGQDGTIRLWNLNTHQEVLSLAHGAFVWSIAVSPEGNRIASAGWDGRVKVWHGKPKPE